jgi:CheY-like chemotaxis protein
MSLPDIIIGVELPQAIKSNRLRMRPASTVVRSRSSVRCNHPVIDLTELIDMEHLESERNMRPLAGRVGPVALLVERQSASRELTAQLLREQGFHVVVAADGAAGLETARRLRPVLVVTEILLAELDGLALCQRIKEQAPATRVLLLSALSAAARARDTGADGFLSKPISHPKLAAAVGGLLPAHLEEHG